MWRTGTVPPTDREVGQSPAPVELETGSGDDGTLNAQRDAPVGGQAVLEGVMMRGVAHWAVAVRKPTPEQLSEEERVAPRSEAALGEIEVSTFPLDSALRRHRVLRLPIIRGVVALGGSLAIGFRALEISANAQLPAEEGDEDTEDAAEEPQEILAVCGRGRSWSRSLFAIVLFFLIPVGLTSLIKGQLHSSVLFWVIEGLVGPRSSSATWFCSRAYATCGACSSTTAPSTRRSPASRPAWR